MAKQLLWTEPALDKLSPTDSPWLKRTLLPFFGDALQWLTGTATTKDMTEIRQWINILMQEQTKQQGTLVHIISILNVTQYATQVNRQKLNEIMDTFQKVNKDVNMLFNITDILTKHLRYHHVYTYAHTILAYPRDCLIYMRQVATHTMDYITAARTNILSPDILPVEDSEFSKSHQITTTFNNAHAHIIRWHIPFLPVPQDTCTGSRQTPHQCTYRGKSTTTPNICGLQLTSSAWWCMSSAQNLPIVCVVLVLDSWNYCSGEQAWQPNVYKIV